MGEAPGELLGGLTFDADDGPTLPRQRRPAQRLVAPLLALLLLVGVAVVGVRWWSDRDVRDVVGFSRAAYSQAVQQVLLARDATTLATVASRLQPVAGQLDAAAGRLDGSRGGRRAAVVAQVRAEAGVVRALAPLAGLPAAPLAVYGTAGDGLAAAADRESRTRSALRDIAGGDVAGLPDTGAVLRQVATAAGGALVEDVQRSGGELLDGLARAQRTADLRSLAARAGAQRDAVAAARVRLAPSAGGAALDDLLGALAAVRDLQDLTPATTDRWRGVRQQLAQHLGAVGQSTESLAAGSLRARVPLVLDGVDALVARAARAQADWQAQHDAAVAQQAADTAALLRYVTDVTAALGDAEAARAALGQVVGQPLTVDAATVALRPIAGSVTEVANRLRTQTVPAGAQATHAALLARLDALGQPVSAALQDLATATCRDCSAETVATWPPLRDAATGRWDAEAAAWRTATDAAKGAIAARQLPVPPDA